MKFVLFRSDDAIARLGILIEDGVVDASLVIPSAATPQATMVALIDAYETRKLELEALSKSENAAPLASVKLLSPLPRPGKIACCIANYWEHAQRDARALNMFLKNPDAVIGPGDAIQLPAFTEPYAFMHEAELALVFKGPAKSVSQANWRSAIFGYTCLVDVTAREGGRRTWRNNSHWSVHRNRR
jgi:2-keto-4-pentenoate hydratase/2-oxohepta-3-ene-1,7-dioic acid hydratase in catechol pathway